MTTLPPIQTDPGAQIRPAMLGDPMTGPFPNDGPSSGWPFFVAGSPDPTVPGISFPTGPRPAPAGPQAGAGS